MTGAELAERGAGLALMKAGREHKDWAERAFGFVKEFSTIRKQFSAEQLRAWAHRNGLPVPKEPRAWGGVMKRAAREMIVEHIGWTTSQNASRHNGIVSIWRSL